MELTFRSLAEQRPGAAFSRVFEHGWPGWRAWAERQRTPLPSLRDTRRAIRAHMPEMDVLWDALGRGRGGQAQRFLGFWQPPRYLLGCSLAVLEDANGPLLVRNYDLDPGLSESTLLETRWTGTRVAGMVEGLAGLADGINEAGLAAALAFGGREVTGRGFGIPIIMRYLLEQARDRQDAVDLLSAVPCHMAYNVTVLDAAGGWATVQLSPDRPALVTEDRFATNHQGRVEMAEHGRFTRTLERAAHLERLTAGPAGAEAFLRAPLHSTRYDEGFGTVYTAAYRPSSGAIALSWTDGCPAEWTLGAIGERRIRVGYHATGSARLDGQVRPTDRGARIPVSTSAGQDGWDAPEAAPFFAALGRALADPAGADWAALGRGWASSAGR